MSKSIVFVVSIIAYLLPLGAFDVEVHGADLKIKWHGWWPILKRWFSAKG